MLKYMLDTNIVIYTLKNRPAKVRKLFEKHHGQMCLSSVTWGELVYGAEKSARIEHNLAVLEAFAARLKIAKFDTLAATHFGQVRAELSRQGKIIGPYDMMIAGHSRSLGLVLITNNVQEFERTPGLRVQNWV